MKLSLFGMYVNLSRVSRDNSKINILCYTKIRLDKQSKKRKKNKNEVSFRFCINLKFLFFFVFLIRNPRVMERI
jgi:hypothetical protein